MRKFLLNAILLVFIVSFLLFIRSVMADEYDDVTKKLIDLKRSLESSQNATKNNEQNLKQLNIQLDRIKAQVNKLSVEITQKQKEVRDGELALDYQKKLLDQRTLSYYKNIDKNTFSLIEIILADNLSKVLENFFYQKSLLDEDKRTIIKIVVYIKDLEEKRNALQSEEAKLSVIKQEVDKQSQFLAGEVQKSKSYEGELQKQIASLTARQQQILAQKLASLNIPTSAYTTQGGCVDDRNTDPGFSPRYAFFTYGVPNRVGLNQWGAKGRAEAGQNAETILNAYYGNVELKKDYNTGINITVNGTNEYGQNFSNQTWDVETYVKHIYEMPTAWPGEALKAQAIAARSYVLAVTNNGANSICPSQQCQVVKQEENSQAWKDAVDATKGWVLTSGGNPVKAWFSSTHGGYVFKTSDIGWSDTAWTKNAVDSSGGVSNFSDLQNNAYDKNSPWFYCDWGSRAQYNKTAWLKSEEVADIVNALLLAKKDPSVQNHLSQPDKPNPDGTETWNQERVKSELKSRGVTPLNSVSDVSISWDNGIGRTNSITVSGDGGSYNFSGSEFKNFFNLRAPANIQIVGPLFNAEKK